jgi:hypothetical protein
MVGFRAFASRLNMSRAIRKVPFNRVGDVELRELLARWRELSRTRLGDEFFFFRLSLTPIGSVEALTESFAVDHKIGVPRFAAFIEGHSL